MNIPAPSERTIREKIGNSSFTTGAEIQVSESTITCSFVDNNHFSLLLKDIKDSKQNAFNILYLSPNPDCHTG